MFPADIWEYPIPKVGNFSFRFLGKTLDKIQLGDLSIDATIVQAHQHSAGAKKGGLQAKSDTAEVVQAPKYMR